MGDLRTYTPRCLPAHPISKPLCVKPWFLRVDEARGFEPLALPEVAS